MIVLSRLSQLDTATQKANEIKPALRVIDFGVYEVQGSKGNWYQVTCKKDGAGNRIVWCSCEESGKRRTNRACYHMPPAVGAHIILALAQRSHKLSYEPV